MLVHTFYSTMFILAPHSVSVYAWRLKWTE